HGWLFRASSYASKGRSRQQCSEYDQLRGRPCQLRQSLLWLEQPLATLPAPICLQPACRIRLQMERRLMAQYRNRSPNQPDAANPAVTLLFQAERQWRGVAEP